MPGHYTKFLCIDAVSFGRAILKLLPNFPWFFPYCLGTYRIHSQRTRLFNTSFRHIYLMHSKHILRYLAILQNYTQTNHRNGYRWEVMRIASNIPTLMPFICQPRTPLYFIPCLTSGLTSSLTPTLTSSITSGCL